MPELEKCRCTAVLLAGGRSSRMGCDKAWLDYEGRPLWKFQLEKLRAIASEVLISARENIFTDADTGCRIIFDEMPAVGPLGGLRAALKAATFDRVLLLGVDMPAMTSGYLYSLTEEASPEVGLVPQREGYYEGLAAVYPRRLHSVLEEMLSGPDHSFQELHRRAIGRGMMKARPVTPAEESLFQNWNTPGDRG